ncbi:MAG: VWA domain-containing protein, partial [Acidobacteriota bacterium]|nr:VWA domain-containing protein [Acidobacteriota bacterium]
STEDLVGINTTGYVEKVDVRLVELLAAVQDSSGRPVLGLGKEEFKVLEDGREQSLLRFEPVKDLPLHVVIAVDTSASMAKSLGEVQKAAASFLERTLTPKDRAAIVTFSDNPVLKVPFTNDLQVLTGGLAGLVAEHGTALFDSVVFALTYMKGASGQPALLVFTDGGDHVSHLSFKEALEFARRSGIAVYTVGVLVPRLDLEERGWLCKLAGETGGRCFFVDSGAALDGIYRTVEEELRSRYLLAYQPRNAPQEGEFRTVEVKAGSGREVKTIRGYYP